MLANEWIWWTWQFVALACAFGLGWLLQMRTMVAFLHLYTHRMPVEEFQASLSWLLSLIKEYGYRKVGRLSRSEQVLIFDAVQSFKKPGETAVDAVRRLLIDSNESVEENVAIMELLLPYARKGDGGWSGTLRRVLAEHAVTAPEMKTGPCSECGGTRATGHREQCRSWEVQL